MTLYLLLSLSRIAFFFTKWHRDIVKVSRRQGEGMGSCFCTSSLRTSCGLAPNKRRRCLEESSGSPVNGSKVTMSEMAETLTTNMDMLAQKQSKLFI